MKISEEQFQDAADIIGCDLACVKAVAEVESAGSGFNPDGSLKSLFEGHIFHKRTNGIYDSQYPNISYPKWDKTQYGKTYSAEQDRLNLAMSLDRENALCSASFGMFQIMGMNFSLCKFDNVNEFYDFMSENEGNQLQAFCNFVKSSRLDDELVNKNWAGFAKGYNGPGYALNKYDLRLQQAYNKYA